MARIRSIKPEFWSSEQVMECSRDARLLFIGLWNFCDDAGRHPLAPRQIKALIFPGDETLSVADVQRMLYELSKNGLIERYDVDGKQYLQVTGWQHQKIDRPQKPRYPGPPDDRSTNPHREPSTERSTEHREEGKGEERRIAAVDDRAGAKSIFSPEDFDLADQIMLAQGLAKDDPRCIGTAYEAKRWRDQGWKPDVVITTIKRLMAKRSSPPARLRYFEQAIADAHAEMARPVPAGSPRAAGTGPPRRESFADIAMEFEHRRTQTDDRHGPDQHHDTIDG